MDYPKDSTIFPPEFPAPLFSWSDALNKSTKWHIRLSTQNGDVIFSQIADSSNWRPDSALWMKIKELAAYNPVSLTIKYSQLFFPVKGIIAVYDMVKRKFYELPGASDRKYVQSNPNWSPDGSEIIFSHAKRYESSKIDNSKSVLLDIEDVDEFITRQKEFICTRTRSIISDSKSNEC